MGAADSQHEVRVIADELSDAIRERLDALAGELSLERPVTISDDGVWVAARELGRREAQALRRQLQGLGLAVDVVESQGFRAQDGSAHAEADDDLGLLGPDAFDGMTEEPEEASSEVKSLVNGASNGEPSTDERRTDGQEDQRSAELLSWFGSAEEVEESSETSDSDPEEANRVVSDGTASPEDLLGIQAPEPDDAIVERPPASESDSSSPPAHSSSGRSPSPARPVAAMSGSTGFAGLEGPAGAISRSLKEPSSGSSDSPWKEEGSWWVRWGLPAGVVAVLLALTITVVFTEESEEGQVPSGESESAPEPPPDRYVLPEESSNAKTMPDDRSLAELGEEVPEKDEVEKDPSESDKAAAAELFMEGEAHCNLQKYDACIATMEAVVTLDPDNQAAYEHILRARAAKERRDNPPPITGPVQPSTVIIGPDGEGANDDDVTEGVNGESPGGGNNAEGGTREPGQGTTEGATEGTREAEREPQFEIDAQGRKVMVISPEEEPPPEENPRDDGDDSDSTDVLEKKEEGGGTSKEAGGSELPSGSKP